MPLLLLVFVQVIYMTEGQKKNRLFDLLRRVEPPTIVFVNIKKNCDVLVKNLLKEGFSANVYHGGKTQDQREVCTRSCIPLHDGPNSRIVFSSPGSAAKLQGRRV